MNYKPQQWGPLLRARDGVDFKSNQFKKPLF